MTNKNITSERTLIGMFNIDDVLDFKYCPVCGNELLEVYLGDYAGHANCDSDDCDSFSFYIGAEKDGNISHFYPFKRFYW